jgi:hypothetical protein
MPPPRDKLALWTERLRADWTLDPSDRGRHKRAPVHPAELPQVLRKIRTVNLDAVDCLVILQRGDHLLQLKVTDERVLASDPRNPNYQNVAIPEADLAGFIERHFKLDDAGGNRPLTPARIIEWIALAVVLSALAAAAAFTLRYMRAEGGFLPRPQVEAIASSAEAEGLLRSHQGIYVSQLRDGGLALELTADGGYHFYDIWRGGSGHFILDQVNAGRIQPVRHEGAVALMADNHFLFIVRGDKEIDFQGRSFQRIGWSRDELPYLAFP